jgi:hypothetical protein
MNRWHKIFAVAYDRQGSGVLNPSFLEMVIKDALAITIADTRAKHMHSKLWLSLN